MYKQGNARGTGEVRRGAELPPFISIVQYPGRPVILGMEKVPRRIPSPRIGSGRPTD